MLLSNSTVQSMFSLLPLFSCIFHPLRLFSAYIAVPTCEIHRSPLHRLQKSVNLPWLYLVDSLIFDLTTCTSLTLVTSFLLFLVFFSPPLLLSSFESPSYVFGAESTTWSTIAPAGMLPLERSHHSAVLFGHHMVFSAPFSLCIPLPPVSF